MSSSDPENPLAKDARLTPPVDEPPPELKSQDLSSAERAARRRRETQKIREERQRLREERRAFRLEQKRAEARAKRKEEIPRRAPADDPSSNGAGEADLPATETPSEGRREPEAIPPTKEKANRMRQRRSLRLLLRLALFVLLPTLISAVYYYRYASDQYESVALVTIYSAETLAPQPAGITALIGLGSGSSAVMDGLSVREYIYSRDILQRLQQDESFIEHYRDPTKDWYTRLPADSSFEDAFEDYENRVQVEVDPNSGVATIRVLSYTPEAAQRFLQAIIRYGEEMVNQLSERARDDQVSFAEVEVEEAEERLSTARQKLIEVQQERGEFNPEQSALAQLQIRTSLEAEAAKARAELAQLMAVMTPDAPAVVGAKERVRSLAGQVAATSRRMVAKGEEEESLNKSAAQFEAALVEKEFATTAYQSAMSSLELARAQAARKHRYLATISPPSLADESTYPKRWLRVLTVFLCSFLLLGIGSLLIATVKEHSQL